MSESDEIGSRERRVPQWILPLALFGAFSVAGMVGGLIHQHSQLVKARAEMAGLKQEIQVVRQDATAANLRLVRQIEAVTDELDSTRNHFNQSADKTTRAVRSQSQQLETRFAKNLAESREEQRKLFDAEIGRIKDTHEETSARLSNINTEVGEVKTQVANTRTELGRTVSDLKRMNGDMGVMSGLIATNSKELTALRALGERDYYEFTLSKKQARRMLAGVNLVYKKADTKRNRFTLEVIADDRRVEKKDRTINEPVQFYVPTKARQPYEIVVNEVKKDTIVGYLSAPKTQVALR